MASQIDSTFINNLLVAGFNSKLKLILREICAEHPTLSYEMLVNNHCVSQLEIENLSCSNKRKKRKKNKVLEQQELCMAKKADGLQCTRRRKDNCDYCGKHINNTKFGRVDDDIKYQDTDKYIKTTHEKINGTDYLIDEQNIVYTFDKNNPTVLGTRINGKLVFADAIL